MKTSLMMGAALMSATAHAETHVNTDLSEKLMQNFMDYAGLSPETPSVDLAGEDSKKPRVMAFGFEQSDSTENGLVGYDLGLNFDLGWSYELPMYNQD